MMKQWPMKARGLVQLGDEFFLLRKSSGLASVVISNPNFSEWIIGKYVPLRILHTRLPTLIFLTRRHTLLLQDLLARNTVIILRDSSHYLSPKLYFNMNLSPQLSDATIGRSGKYKALREASSHKGTVGILSRFAHTYAASLKHSADSAIGIHPVHPGDGIIVRDRLENDKASYEAPSATGLGSVDYPLIRPRLCISKYMSRSTLSVRPKFLKTFNTLLSSKSRRLQQPSTEAPMSILGIPYSHQDKSPSSRATKSLIAGYKLMNGDESDIVYHEAKAAPYHQSERFSSDAVRRSQKSIIASKWGSVSESIIPTLHYLDPLRRTLDDLKRSIASIERKVIDNRKIIGKSGLDGSMSERDISDTTRKTNFDFNHVTEQVYRMLERKIRIERERRGL